MMKRLISLLLAILCLFTAVPALANTLPQPIETIPYEDIEEPRDGLHHYLLLCVDQWRAHATDRLINLGNTDGLVLLTLDTRANRIMLTSLIRDALVERPDGVIGRVNYICKNYGPEALCKVLSQHFGIKIEKYILFDFQQVANIVDYMGGVEIEVNASEASYLRRYPLSPTQTTPKMNRAGTYLFTGRAAVIYMRIRKAGGGGDLMRTQRVRTVLSTLADKCREITYEQARALVDSIAENTTLTNMTLDEMVQAMEYAYGLRSCTIEELRIPRDDTYKSITYAGMSVKEIDWVQNRAALDEFLTSGWLVAEEEFFDD